MRDRKGSTRRVSVRSSSLGAVRSGRDPGRGSERRVRFSMASPARARGRSFDDAGTELVRRRRRSSSSSNSCRGRSRYSLDTGTQQKNLKMQQQQLLQQRRRQTQTQRLEKQQKTQKQQQKQQQKTAAARRKRKARAKQRSKAEDEALRQESWNFACWRWFWVLSWPVILPGAVAIYFMFRRARAENESWMTWGVYWESLSVWLLHELGFREDSSGAALFLQLPGSSPMILFPLKMWLRAARLLSRLWIEHKFYADPPGQLHRKMSRLAFMDKAVNQEDIEQLVIIGGGLSTYGYNETFLGKRVRAVFEINTKAVQSAKKKLMRAAGVHARHVHFVRAQKSIEDYHRWLVDLALADFDTEARTLFLINENMWTWSPESAERLLAEIGEIIVVHPRHTVAFAYLDDSLVDEAGVLSRLQHGAYQFGLPEDSEAKWLAKHAHLAPLEYAHFEDEGMGLLICTSPLNVPIDGNTRLNPLQS